MIVSSLVERRRGGPGRGGDRAPLVAELELEVLGLVDERSLAWSPVSSSTARLLPHSTPGDSHAELDVDLDIDLQGRRRRQRALPQRGQLAGPAEPEISPACAAAAGAGRLTR
jgi:hypothetical protein